MRGGMDRRSSGVSARAEHGRPSERNAFGCGRARLRDRPAATSAGRNTQARFSLSIRGSVVTTWDVPRALGGTSILTDQASGEPCVERWVEGAGKQAMTFSLRTAVKTDPYSGLPSPLRFKLPWHANRQGTIVIEFKSLTLRGSEHDSPLVGTGETAELAGSAEFCQ